MGYEFMKTIEVVAAIIKDNDKVLAICRGYGEFINMWEFPGGKIEPNESKEDALHREISEELEVAINIEEFLMTVEYDYPNFHLTMHCFICTLKDGIIKLNDHNDACWANKDKLKELNWIPADLDIVDKLMNIL